VSKLDHTLKGVSDDMNDIKPSFIYRLKDRWLHSRLRRVLETYYYNVENFLRNLPLFIKMAWRWRSWDYIYTINSLCAMLEQSAKMTRKNSHHQGAEKTYRRQLTAAGLIRKAYDDKTDATISYLIKKNHHFFKRISPNLLELCQKEVTCPRIYDGMYSVAQKRSSDAEQKRKDEAWFYLKKYLENFWD